jgi:hypothetical protein
LTIFFCVFSLFCNGATIAEPSATTIGVYRWDAYHGGTGNVYLTVKKCLTPSEYHYKLPFFGLVNSDGTVDADDTDVQEKMDQEIAYAKYGGVDYWAFLRYVDGINPVMNPLNEPYSMYQSSPKKEDVKFCWILSHGLQDQNQSYWADEKVKTVNAMKDSQWIRVLENRPLLYVLWDAAGSNLSSRLNEIRTLVQSEGMTNPYIVGIGISTGCDARTEWTPSGGKGDAWYNYKNAVVGMNNGLLAASNKTVLVAHVNWDSRPYHDNPPSWWANPPNSWYQMPTSSEYRDLVQDAVNKSQQNATKCEANTIFVYAWNEFTEGGIMCPTRRVDGTIDTSVLKGLSEVKKTLTVSNLNLIANPGFMGTSSWTLYVNSSAGASATLATDDGMGKVAITNSGITTSDTYNSINLTCI